VVVLCLAMGLAACCCWSCFLSGWTMMQAAVAGTCCRASAGRSEACSCSCSCSGCSYCLFVARIGRRVMVIIGDAGRRRHGVYPLFNHLSTRVGSNNDNMHPRKSLPPFQATQTTSTCPTPISYLMYLCAFVLTICR
jgi:hypothetical protein